MLPRRKYYKNYGREAPELVVPEAGRYLWDWYMDVTSRVQRVREGVCCPIAPSDWLGWAQITGEIVYTSEYDILAVMDVAFCEEMNKELEARRDAAQDEAEQKAKRK